MTYYRPLAVQRVVLLGFGEFERNALASYLRLSGARVPAYEQVFSLAEADFVIADADDPTAVAQAVGTGRVGDTMAIGATAPNGALAWAMRPLDPMQVFRELDAAVALRHGDAPGQARRESRPMPLSSLAAAAAASRPAATAAPTVTPAPQRQAPAPASTTSAATAASPSAMPPSSDTAPRPASSSRPSGRRAGESAAPASALLVDDSDIALRYLQRQLHAIGLRTDCASNSARALEMLSQQRFDVVFLDLDLGPSSDLDGLALCQMIRKARRGAIAASAPRVVIVSAHHSATDRVRGTLAGCDDFLAKPLDEEALLRTLRNLALVAPAEPSRRKRRESAPNSGPVPLAGPLGSGSTADMTPAADTSTGASPDRGL